MKFSSLVRQTLTVGLTAGLFSAIGAEINAAGDDKTIVFANLDWVGQEISNGIFEETLKEMGYTVEYRNTSNLPMFQAIADGDIDLFTEQWMSAPRAAFEKFEARGELENAGLLGITGSTSIFYPTYVEELCPGLPDVNALNGCVELFTSPETVPKGRIVDYPIEWSPWTPDWVTAFKLDYTTVPAGSEAAIIAELRSAYTRKDPILFVLWEPHWVHSEFEVKAIKMPAHDPECESNAAWGVNPDAVRDCAKFAADIIKVTRPGFSDEHPEVYRLLKAFQISNADQASVMVDMENNGVDVKTGVSNWMAANESVWRNWISKAGS